MKEEKTNYFAMIMGVLILLFILVIGTVIFNKNVNDMVMRDNCCDGQFCTDTYYTFEDNLCHLSLCENNPFSLRDKPKNCVYSGKNITKHNALSKYTT